MAELYECCDCKNVVMLVDCKQIKQDAIVTCAKNEDEIDVNCWNCNLKPTNSKKCLDFIKDEKKKHPKFRQFTNEEIFG